MDNNRNIGFTRRIFATVVVLLAVMLPGASHYAYSQRPYSPQAVEDAYRKAYNLRYSPKGMQIVDSIYKTYGEKLSPKMQCKLLDIPVAYYIHNSDESKVRISCKLLRQKARESGQDSILFWNYNKESAFFLKHNRVYEALELAKEMKNDADSLKSPFGAYLMQMTVGNIYRMRNDKELAKDSYLKALNIQKKSLPHIDASMTRVHLSEYYRTKPDRTDTDIDSAKDLVVEGLNFTRDTLMRTSLLSEEALIHHSLNEFEAFNRSYHRMLETLGTDTLPDDFIQVAYLKKMLEGDYDGAISLIERIPSKYDQHIALYMIHKGQEKYDLALKEYENANHELNRIRESERKGELEELTSLIGNLELTIENHKLREQENVSSQKSNRSLGIVLFIGIMMVLLFQYFVVKLWRKAKIANDRLAEKNRELQEARDTAVHSEKIKTMFIQNMSHEIRTPLNAIVGFSDILATQNEELDHHERNDYNQLIHHNCDMLTTIVDDILTIADIESGKYEMKWSQVKVNSLCHKAIESVRHRLRRHVALRFETEVTDNFEILTDENRLSQVLNNILVNACKYTDEGHIELNVSIKGSRLVFKVYDTGPGIPVEKRKEIFDRFIKLDSFHQGTGLGLNICRSIIEMMQGEIYVDDAYNEGSCFVVEIPVRLHNEAKSKNKKTTNHAAASTKHR